MIVERNNGYVRMKSSRSCYAIDKVPEREVCVGLCGWYACVSVESDSGGGEVQCVGEVCVSVASEG